MLDRIADRGSDGVILKAPDHPLVAAAVARLAERGIPVVTFVTDLPASRRAAYVGVDNRAAGATAAYLVTSWARRRRPGAGDAEQLVVPRRGGARGRLPGGDGRPGAAPDGPRGDRHRRAGRDDARRGPRDARGRTRHRRLLLDRRRQPRHPRRLRRARPDPRGVRRPRPRRGQPAAAPHPADLGGAPPRPARRHAPRLPAAAPGARRAAGQPGQRAVADPGGDAVQRAVDAAGRPRTRCAGARSSRRSRPTAQPAPSPRRGRGARARPG